MKIKFIPLFILIALSMFYCSSEKPQVVLSNPEAFAYALDQGWELNASVVVRGFEQKQEADTFFASVSYTIDLVTPNDTIKQVDTGKMNETNEEVFLDLMVESQIEMDSNFVAGDYRLIFFVQDDFSGTKDTAEVAFTLSKE